MWSSVPAGLVASVGLGLVSRLFMTSSMNRRRHYALGAIVGKFYPPHLGHSYLIDSAQQQCEALTVVVSWRRGEDPPGELRAAWIREMHPSVDVIADEDIYEDDANSKLWADLTVNKYLNGRKPDAVFTSEAYGIEWARHIGCEHVSVDSKRVTVPISGTLVRSDPYANFDFLHPVVRRYYAKLVVVIGAESTGKSVLTNRLAMRFFGAGMVGEYGREKTDQNLKERGATAQGDGFSTPEWRTDDFVVIAEKQSVQIDQNLEDSPLVIADTDAVATQVWHERYMGGRSERVEEIIKRFNTGNDVDLYLLCVTDGAPFIQDGTRDGNDSGMRDWMDGRFREMLSGRQNVVILSGNFEERYTKAVEVIRTRFPQVVAQFEE